MLFTIVVFIFTLLILVISHELGHFLAAKKFGVKVLEFGFGLPPRVFGKKLGETIFSLNWLPIGGFVRLFGEDETDKQVLNSKRSFAAKPVLQRIVIVAAGVVVNILLAWVLFYAVLISQDFKILYPVPQRVVFVADVENDSPAETAGIEPEQRILSVDGKEVNSIEETISIIRNKADLPVEVIVSNLDGKEQKELKVIPQLDSSGEGKIGIALSPIPFKHYNTIPEKIISAPWYSWDLTRLTFQGFGMLFTNLAQKDFQTASESVAGPVGLVAITGNIIGSGAVFFYLWFVGYLSLTLAILNILPFPALDGGRIFFLLIEAVARRKVKPEIERWVHTVGMALLIALIAVITLSDIGKLLP